jgi:two-component system sensor histidine kinase/response regulator
LGNQLLDLEGVSLISSPLPQGVEAKPPERPVLLVVDDEPRNRALMSAYLAGQYQVREAENGPEALALCERGGIDLVVLDVMMPGMSGFEVCRSLKNRAREDFLPVLLLTALSEQDDRNAGLEAGADDFLAKPVNRQELLLRVQHFLALRTERQTVARQYEALHELVALKDDLVTLMVHDLRNPLTGVLGLLQVMEAEAPDAVSRADATAAREGAEKLREALDDMLQVRQLEEGRLELQRRAESLESLTAEAAASLEGAARMRRLDLLRAVEPGLTVDGDRRLLRRAIENLVSNAVKFSPAGNSVRISAARSGSLIEISVADRGGGVPNVAREGLFEKFGGVYTRRASDRRGYGLGLYFVRLVAEAHGGRITATDNPDGGTVMTMTLPGTTGASSGAISGTGAP